MKLRQAIKVFKKSHRGEAIRGQTMTSAMKRWNKQPAERRCYSSDKMGALK